MRKIAEGIYRLRFGRPEKQTPFSVLKPLAPPPVRGPAAEDARKPAPPDETVFTFRRSARGCVISFPMDAGEHLYGFGLQLKSFDQTGLKKELRVNSDPVADTGDSHAPVPFFVSTAGYGVLVDTLRYATFYAGAHQTAAELSESAAAPQRVGLSTDELYAARAAASRRMVIEIPAARGADLYWFSGPSLRDAVMRYVRFCGGGCLPPLWGLGNWYRGKADYTAADFLNLIDRFRADGIPVDVVGVEPGWQTRSYSCSFVWNPERFPEPGRFIAESAARGARLNLWEHAFTHPESPMFRELRPVSGDTAVWNGLVPDFALPDARRAFADYHDRLLIGQGVSGFKLDECDNSDYIKTPWSFPETSVFPSGLDGETMHSALGTLYQHTILEPFRRRNLRTYGEVRSAHAFCPSLPYVLYSDLYDHADFIRGLVNAGFSGLLWTPEVRTAASTADLLRRMQATVFSPQSLINAWFLKNPPWDQIERARNNRDELLPERDELRRLCKGVLELRMRFIPYLYAAFAKYRFTGLPPFRALVMDYPGDPQTYTVDDEYLMGDHLLVAPLTAAADSREVYLPPGVWHCFWTGRRLEGGRRHTVTPPLEQIPLYVRDNSLLPLAAPLPCVADDARFDLDVRVYGNRPAPFDLHEDDGVSYDYERGIHATLRLEFADGKGTATRSGAYPVQRHHVRSWTVV